MPPATKIKAILSRIENTLSTDDSMERLPYARDLAPVPDALLRLLQVQPVPDAVVFPRSTEEVSKALRQACRDRVPVTPRAGSTTSLFAAVPTRGGILLDLTGLSGVMDLDEGEPSATVLAGTTFAALERHLRAKEFALRSYPSSAPAATVGGWLCSGGLGIGSLRFGPFCQQVISAEFVQPDGRVVIVTPETIPSLRDLAESEGTLGVVTAVKLRVRTRPEQEAVRLFAAPDAGKTGRLMQRLIEAQAYFVGFYDRQTLSDLKKAGAGDDWPVGSDLVVAVFEEDGKGASISAAVVAEASAVELGAEMAQRFWKEKFKILRLKRLGPGLMGGEAVIPLSNLSRYANATNELKRRRRVRLSSHGYVVARDRALTFSMFPTDERKLYSFLLDLSLVKKLYGLALENGGRPYGLGLWNIPYRNHVFSPVESQKRRALKRHLDEYGIMNPGKVLDSNVILSSALFPLSMEALAAVRQVMTEC